MNKKIISILILSCVILFTGCANKSSLGDSGEKPSNNQEQNVEQDQVAKYTIKDYIQVKENLRYDFQGENSEYAEATAYVDYIEGDKFQIRSNNGGTEVCRVFELKDGELKLIFSRPECYYRENFLKKTANADEVLLKEPLVTGTSWVLKDGSKRSITNTEVEVTTPEGTLKALEVTTEGVNGQKDLQYYVLNKGLVKVIRDSEKMKVTSTLKQVTENSQFKSTIRVFYPQVTDTDYAITYEDKEVEFKTNDITKQILENLLKTSSASGDIGAFTPGTTINSLYLNDDGMVYLDLNKKFVEEMNAGSGFESTILQSLANTIGKYYGVDKVYITLDNKPYESGHIAKEKGEPFVANFE